MYFFKIVFAVLFCAVLNINKIFVTCEYDEVEVTAPAPTLPKVKKETRKSLLSKFSQLSESKKAEQALDSSNQGRKVLGVLRSQTTSAPIQKPTDPYTFVVLLNILFLNKAKKSCTGTIIHEYVAITAAHCFVMENHIENIPELSLSFIVLGTKRMRNTGYEQYLPIERVLLHPHYKGWTANLALAYTFSSMTKGNPGKIIPLTTQKSSSPVDSNASVISWGRCGTEPVKLQSGRVTASPKRSLGVDLETNRGDKHKKSLAKSKRQSLRYKMKRGDSENSDESSQKRRSNMAASLSSNISSDVLKYNKDNHKVISNIENKTVESFRTDSFRRRGEFRRSVSSELSIEQFGFVNIVACKRFIEKAKPTKYHINDANDIVCYSSDEHYLTADDSGATVVSQGSLTAVTIGSAECDGEHIAVGMRMNCYCSWIQENLPKPTTDLNCCHDCCTFAKQEK